MQFRLRKNKTGRLSKSLMQDQRKPEIKYEGALRRSQSGQIIAR
jgi:hypothetical protein